MVLRKPSAIITSAIVLSACTRGTSDTSAARGAATSLAASAPTSLNASPARDATVIDFLTAGDCTFGHRGILLNLGDTSMRARMSGAHLAAPEIEVREHEGASWASMRARTVELSFVSSAELKSEAGIVVEARVRGGLAKSAAVYLNGKPLGGLALTRGETTIVSVKTQGVIPRGSNELLLRFIGGGKTAHEQLAEVDWIRLGPNDGEAPYSAPTRGDVVTTVSVGGTSRRAISLRAPGSARCSAHIPNGSVLTGFIGGTGEADAEVRVLVDRTEPRVVGSFHLGGPTDPQGWRPISLPLGDVGTLAGIELVVKASSKGARVAFAEARVVGPADVEPAIAAPKARGVVVVVLGSTTRRMLSLYGGSIAMPELTALANGGMVFESHRATSSFANAALASMLTGVSPREHGASDAEAALSPSVFTVAEAARQAGIVTAMFTANPATTAAYGFSRGWETFGARLPTEETPATAIFDDAGRWLDAHKNDRFLLVVHSRGGHPPWDVTSEELKDLPPAGYVGSMEPKHAGEALAKARRAGNGRLFADPDRERAFALHARALVAHDAALGALVSRIRSIGRELDTVWLVTGDVGIDAAARVPFLEEETLEEGALAVPLIARGPGPAPRERTTLTTSGSDVARAILEALGLRPPPHLSEKSLWTASRRRPERPLLAASTTRFSARWGQFAVVGAREREVKVCDLSLDPDCVSDVRASHPLAAEALHALAWSEFVLKGASSAPARAAVDGPTSTALRAWGR